MKTYLRDIFAILPACYHSGENLGGTTRVDLVAPLGYESLIMTAHTPDLVLGGRGGGGAAKGLLRGSGAEMISP